MHNDGATGLVRFDYDLASRLPSERREARQVKYRAAVSETERSEVEQYPPYSPMSSKGDELSSSLYNNGGREQFPGGLLGL